MKRRSFFGNTAALFVMNVASAGLMFFFMVYLARHLGDVGFGKFSFAVSFTGLFGVLVHLGLDMLLTREIARDKGKSSYYVGLAAGIRVLSSIFTVGLIFLAINLMGYPSDTKTLVYVFGFYVVLSYFARLYKAVLQAHERMDQQALVEIASKLVVTLAGILVLHYGGGLYAVAGVFLLGSLVDFLLSMFVCARYYTAVSPRVDAVEWSRMLTEAFPFFLSYGLLMVSFRIDVVLLSFLQTDAVVGWYSAAYKFLEGLNMFPDIVVVAAFPVFSRLYKTSRGRLGAMYSNIVSFFLVLGLPMAVGTTILASDLVGVFFGSQFENAVVALRILVWSEVAVFVYYTTGTLLNAVNLQKTNLRAVALGACANVLINLALIPHFAHVGAAYAKLVSETLVAAYGIIALHQAGFRLKIGSLLAKVVLASAVMAAVVYHLQWLGIKAIPVGALTYFAALWLFWRPSSADIKKILASFTEP